MRAVKRARRGPDAESGTSELQIEGLATGGEGVAHLEIGGARTAVYVSGTLPGEHVLVRWEQSGKRVQTDLLRVLAPSPDRKEPECADATACGGCDWMHASLEAQQREHARRLERLLALPVSHHEPSSALGSRTRMRLHVRSRGEGAQVGYFRARSNTLLVPARCHVVDPRLEAARVELAGALRTQRGLEGDLSLSLGVGGKVVVDLVLASGDPSGPLLGALDRLVSVGTLAGVRVLVRGMRPICIGDPAPVTEAADGAPLHLAAGGFAQSSPSMSRALAERVMAAVDGLVTKPDLRIFEMHAGAGNFSVLLATRSTRLETFELSAPAVEAARQNLAARGLSARLHVAAAETVALPNRLPLLVLDPPREGAREVMQNARKARVAAIVYVSCEPTSLARDLALLGEDYTQVGLELFEMFPQTSHVETLAVLVRRPG